MMTNPFPTITQNPYQGSFNEAIAMLVNARLPEVAVSGTPRHY